MQQVTALGAQGRGYLTAFLSGPALPIGGTSGMSAISCPRLPLKKEKENGRSLGSTPHYVTSMAASIASSHCGCRARLVKGSAERVTARSEGPEAWAHPLPGPENGAVLIAHPMMFTTSQTYFSHSASAPHAGPFLAARFPEPEYL